MELKKSKKADLENKRPMFLQVGLVLSLSMALIAFEWSNEDHKETMGLPLTGESIPDDIIPVTRTKEKLPPKPVVPEFKIIPNDPELIEFVPTFDMGARPGDIVEWNFKDEPIDSSDYIPFRKVEDMPTFMGGDLNEFHKYIQTRIKYPNEAVELGLEGRVYVDFVVDKNGKVTNVSILRGVDKILDDAVIIEVQASPLWTPGKQRGKPVNVAFSMPVIFKLQK
jgi:periplasmic protein TonB